MNTLVVQMTGDRNWTSEKAIEKAFTDLEASLLESGVIAIYGPPLMLLRHGRARGADSLSQVVAERIGWIVELGEDGKGGHPAKWRDENGNFRRWAGPERNKLMLDMEPNPDVVIAFHDDLDSSKGTKNCVQEAIKRDYPVFIYDSNGNGRQLHSPSTGLFAAGGSECD